MKRALFVGVALAAAMVSSNAGAWHNQGHMMTAEVAWQHMSAGAKCRASWLLASNTEYDRGLVANVVLPSGTLEPGEARFVNAATWPDRIKAPGAGFASDGDDPNGPKAKGPANNIGLTDKVLHKYWHFADNPVPAGSGPAAPNINSIERIGAFNGVLGQALPTNAAAKAKARALKAYDLVWLLHIVGDVHQPLHNASQYGAVFKTPAPGMDAGGNDILISNYPGFSELHGFWDGAPGDAKGAQTLGIAIYAARNLDAPAAPQAAILTPATWAQESYQLAVDYAYVQPIQLQSIGPFTPTTTYATNASLKAREQVALGGVRLASLLNAALTWSGAPGCP